MSNPGYPRGVGTGRMGIILIRFRIRRGIPRPRGGARVRGNPGELQRPPTTPGDPGREKREGGKEEGVVTSCYKFFFKRESLSFTLPFTHPISSVQGKRGNPGLAGVHPETPARGCAARPSGIPTCRKTSRGGRKRQGKVTRIVTRGFERTGNQWVSAGPGLARGLHVIGGAGMFP